jgi:ketosteroid isomerase-like protein
MTAVDHVDRLIEQYQLALDEFMKGNPEPVQELFSHRDDASLANPYGPPVRGWDEVAKTTEHAASLRRDGRATSFEIVAKYVTAELAYVVQIEHLESKVGEREEITPYALRATMIFEPRMAPGR